MSDFHQRTRPWQSGAGGGPLLRGRRLEAQKAGAATIHFIHGNGFCGGVYWAFLQKFLPEFSLFLHDLEGHGDSEAPRHFSGVDAIAARVPEVMREQGLLDGRPLIGMGHSFGAALTLKVAAANPGLFQSVVLLDPIVFEPALWLGLRTMAALHVHPMMRAARGRRRRWPSRQAALDHLRGRGIYQGWPEESLEDFVDHATRDDRGERLLSCPPELEAQIYGHPIRTWPDFRGIAVPTAFIHGAESYPFLRPSARRARHLNFRVEVRSLPGRHCFMLEDPSAT
ncbi:MAG TPA: alpha/beta hydrolase, partial [Candidatus Binatia bacterium]|nr:alpha/beta hydrolase [Candidatus Binatia bacterium]